MIDSLTYLLSAGFMAAIGGSWDVSPPSDSAADESLIEVVRGMVYDGAQYLRHSDFGVLVLMKPSMELIWGAGDILSVSFAEPGSIEGRSRRLGMLFASSGVGCVVGPLITDRFVKIDYPPSIQRLCLWGMASVALGCALMGMFACQLRALYFAVAMRAMGSSIVWVNSALLLQHFSAPEMLGRVTSIELAFTLLAQIVSALGAGVLEDRANWSPGQLSFALCGVSSFFLVLWIVFHLGGRGAAAHEKSITTRDESGFRKEVSSIDTTNELTSLLGSRSATPLST